MRICIDARGIKSLADGHGRYERELVLALAEIDSDNDYILLLNEKFEGTLVGQPNFRQIRRPGRHDSISNLRNGASFIDRLGVDLFHSLHQFLPFDIRTPSVVTLHDVFRLDRPGLVRSGAVGRFITWLEELRDSRAIPYALDRAEHIISISKASLDRAHDLTGVDTSKATVIPHGVDPRLLSAPRGGDNGDGNGRKSGARPYFLMLGNSNRHKNVDGAIAAMGRLMDHPDVELRVVGRGAEYWRLWAVGTRHGVSSRVRLKGPVPEGELTDLYQNATALVFPSLMEGFGLPILEAQALGCPVIASNTGSPAEVAGEAAVLVDPNDPESIADGMRVLLTEPERRAELAQLGRVRARRFTWKRAAQATLEVYRSVGKRRRADVRAGSPSVHREVRT